MQWRIYLTILAAVLLFKCVVIITRKETFQKLNYSTIVFHPLNISTNRPNYPNMVIAEKQNTQRPIKIAFYHPYHGGLKMQMKNIQMSKCEYKNCHVQFSGVTSRFVDAHAVLFQGNYIPRITPERRNRDQVFVFIDFEAPQYLHITNLNNLKWRNFFNWTMTYRIDSDIVYTYGSVVPHPGFANFSHQSHIFSNNSQRENSSFTSMDILKTAVHKNLPPALPGKSYRTIFRQKTGIAAWLVSHCVTASKREIYVKMMQKYVNIDVFGKCSNRYCSRNTDCEKSIAKKYFFYISFENSLCKDYITEKEYSWFSEDIITVVRGGRNYREHLPEGTYIDAGDFKSPAQLAYFLRDLANDEDRYIGYLRRKDHFKVVEQPPIHQRAYCELCKRLNNLNNYRKWYKDISAWWRKDICTQPMDLH